GTGRPRSRSQSCMVAISSRWPTTMRSHRIATSWRAPWEGAQPAMITACAWCGIMPDMNSTSASLYGSRPRPGGVAWRPEDGARAHPLPNAAAASHVASARREIVAIRRSQGRIVVDSPTSRYRSLRNVTNRRTLELVGVLFVLLTDVLHQLFVRPRPSG